MNKYRIFEIFQPFYI